MARNRFTWVANDVGTLAGSKVLGATGAPALVVSRADAAAVLIGASSQSPAIRWRGNIEIADGEEDFGTRLFSRLPPGPPDDVLPQARWLTLAMSRSSQAEHLSQAHADQLLKRVALANPREGGSLANAIAEPGSLLLFTDAPLPSDAELGTETSLLSSPQPLPVAETKRARRRSPRRQRSAVTAKPAATVSRPLSPLDLPGVVD